MIAAATKTSPTSGIIHLPQKRYTSGAITLHRLMAGLIVLVAMFGLLYDDIPKSSQDWFLNLHAVFGTLTGLLLVARIAWRRQHRPPPLPASFGPLNRLVSHWGHVGLYALMALVPLAGLAALLARGKGIDFGLFEILSPLARTPEIARPAKQVHALLAYGLLAAAAAHILVALAHQLILRDGLLLRMMPVKNSAGQ